jgi:nitroreductase / dihydropteridine reductase
MSLLKDLNWRYATKKMSGKKVSEKKLNIILDATNLTSSSYGLQPYTIVVVSKKATKAKLMAAAYNQPQVGDSSHILVFTVPLKLSEADAQAFIDNVAATRKMPVAVLDGYKGMIIGSINAMTAEQQQVWAAKQAYIALGTALIAAAEQKIDACPMEGFNGAQFDEILGLTKKGLKSVVILPIGFRAADDAAANYTKVRKPKDSMFQLVK